MPISEENGDTNRMHIKAQYRGHGRYQNRDVFDMNLQEGEELWGAAAADADHPMRNAKGTIAQLSATPYQIAKASVPNSTFKGGLVPHTYDVMSLESDWDNAEADTQSAELPMMSKVEQAGLMRMAHLMPAKYRAGEGSDQNLMVGDWRYRTNYARKKPVTTKFDDGRRNWSDLHQLQQAVPNYRNNRGIIGAPTSEEFTEAEYKGAHPGSGLANHMTRETAMNTLRTLKATWDGGVGKGVAAGLATGLFSTWLRSSGSEKHFMDQYGVSLVSLVGSAKARKFGY